MSRAVLPLLWLLLLAELAGGVLRAPYLAWNEIRLCRSMALLRGFPLYPGRDGIGPIIGTLHTPLSHVFYMPAAMVPDASTALITGSLLAVMAVFLPLAWVMFRGARMAAALCFLYFAFLMVQSPSTYNVLFMIHADAPAVGFATLACGLLIRAADRKITDYCLAGLAAALSLACKQTMAPVVIALALYLLLAVGWRAMMQFLCAAAAGGALLLAVILTVWPARDVLFNIWTLASARPLKRGGLEILMEAYRQIRLDTLPAVLPLLFIAFYERTKDIKQFVRTNRWTVFALCGMCMLPVSVKAMVTIGSDINHLGVVLYFLFAAASLAIQQHLTDAENPALQLSARLFLAIGIVVSLAPGLAFSVGSGLRNLRGNSLQVALTYEREHPGRAYFPWNPAVALLDGGRLYQVDAALADREAVGYALTGEQFRSGLPKRFAIVALPPGERMQSKALLDLTAGYRPILDPELPGWTVLASAP